MKVVVYSTTTCPYCKMLKDYLTGRSIDFVEKLVDQDEGAKAEMMKISGGFLGVPFIVVEAENGSKETVLGFDRGRLNAALGIQ